MSSRLGRQRGPAVAPTTQSRAELAHPDADPEAGATATEYALLVGFIAVVIGVAIAFFGSQLSSFYAAINNALSSWLS
jgi:Flp pilus assembly pilin Flp